MPEETEIPATDNKLLLSLLRDIRREQRETRQELAALLHGQTAWAITWGVVTAATVGVTIWLRRGFSEAALNTKPNRVASLAAELGCEDEPAPPAPAKTILLAAFPPGYERGSFRLVPGGVELRAKGKPALFIAEPSDE